MKSPLGNTLATALLTASVALAHYANMGLDGVSCYIYNGIKGTPEGHVIVRNSNGTWIDHDNLENRGNITVIRSKADYDRLAHKTKIGIVCAPDSIDSTEIGVPYIEREPSDAEFYAGEQTVYARRQQRYLRTLCIIRFCRCLRSTERKAEKTATVQNTTATVQNTTATVQNTTATVQNTTATVQNTTATVQNTTETVWTAKMAGQDKTKNLTETEK